MGAALKGAGGEAGVEAGGLGGPGGGSPGAVDAEAGTVAQARNLPDWIGPFPLARRLHQELGAPVGIGNDVPVAPDAGVKLGAGQPYRSLLGGFWGTRVGRGPVLDGKPWLGRR